MIYNDDYPYKDTFPGFISKGYYPITSKKSNNTIYTDIIEFFHLIYIKDPSSKQIYIQILHSFYLIRYNLKDTMEDSNISDSSYMIYSYYF
jgi:hypothetical protein